MSDVLWVFVDLLSGLTMRGSKLLVQTEPQQSGCWDVVPKWGLKVSNVGITTTTDCQLGHWADTRSRGLMLLNPASCTEGSTIWVSVTVGRILCSCLSDSSLSLFHFPLWSFISSLIKILYIYTARWPNRATIPLPTFLHTLLCRI